MSGRYVISMKIEAETREEAIACFDARVAELRADGYCEQISAGGGGDLWGESFEIYVAPKQPSLAERVERLERAEQRSRVFRTGGEGRRGDE